jgi:hypothetical protein
VNPAFTNDDDAFHAFNDLMSGDDDQEEAHLKADSFVWRLLAESGYPKLAAAVRSASKDWWWA